MFGLTNTLSRLGGACARIYRDLQGISFVNSIRVLPAEAVEAKLRESCSSPQYQVLSGSKFISSFGIDPANPSRLTRKRRRGDFSHSGRAVDFKATHEMIVFSRGEHPLSVSYKEKREVDIVEEALQKRKCPEYEESERLPEEVLKQEGTMTDALWGRLRSPGNNKTTAILSKSLRPGDTLSLLGRSDDYVDELTAWSTNENGHRGFSSSERIAFIRQRVQQLNSEYNHGAEDAVQVKKRRVRA